MVTASEPSAPAAPSEPVSPPTTLNIFVESERLFALFDIDMVIGKSFLDTTLPAAALAPLSYVILPLNNPEPAEIIPPIDGVVIVPPPALVIVISPVSIVCDRFC